MRFTQLALTIGIVSGASISAFAQTSSPAVGVNGHVSTATGLSPGGGINARSGMLSGASMNSTIANAPRWGTNHSGAPATNGAATQPAAAAQAPGGIYRRPAAFNRSAPPLGYMRAAGAMPTYPSSRWSTYAPQTSGRSFSNFGGRTFSRGYYSRQISGYGYGIYNNPYSYSMSSTNHGSYAGNGYGTNTSSQYGNGLGMNATAPIGAGVGSSFGGRGGMFVGRTGNAGPR